jgi:hypothetical protein
MKLSIEQITLLEKAMYKLESADSYLQIALGDSPLRDQLYERLEEVCAEIEMLIEEAEMVDSLEV